MDLNFFSRGIVLGFAIAAPVGPIGILCIQRTLTQGWQFGLVSGLGAATADAIYGAIAGFGLLFISQVLVEQQFWLRLLGGLFLGYLGVSAMVASLRPPALDRSSAGNHCNETSVANAITTQWLTAYGSTLALTLANPITILSFTAIFAGMGVTTTHWPGASLLVSGIFLGSATWWLLLCSLTHRLNQRISDRHLRWVNGLSAGIILAFAIVAIASLRQ